jgi:hypothetical protein
MRYVGWTLMVSGALVGVALAAGACLSVAGINSNLTYGSPDGSVAGGACPSTTPTTLFVTNQAFASQVTLVLNDSYVYLNILYGTDDSDNGTAGVLGCPKIGCGGTPDTIGLSVNNAIGSDTSAIYGGAAASASHVYYTVGPDGQSVGQNAGFINETNLDGNDPTSFLTGLDQPDYIVASDAGLFFVNDPDGFGDAGTGGAVWQVYECPLSGCSQPTLVMNGEPAAAYGIAVDPANLYVFDLGTGVGYGNIFACPLGQECRDTPAPLVSGLSTSAPLYMNASSANGGYTTDTFAGDGIALYRTSDISGSIQRIDLATHEATTIADGIKTPSSLALDATYVYWVDFEGDIQRTAKDGMGSVETILCGLSFPSALAVDDTYVYIAIVDPAGPSGQPTEVVTIPVPP